MFLHAKPYQGGEAICVRPEEKETLCCVFLPLLNFEDVMHEIPLKPTNTQFYLDNHSITMRPAVKACIQDIILGNHTKAHGIRPNWLSGIRHTVRLDLGTIQNRDVGIRHKKLCYC